MTARCLWVIKYDGYEDTTPTLPGDCNIVVTIQTLFDTETL